LKAGKNTDSSGFGMKYNNKFKHLLEHVT